MLSESGSKRPEQLPGGSAGNPLPRFSAGRLNGCWERCSGAHVPTPNSDLELPWGAVDGPVWLTLPACYFISVSLAHLLNFHTTLTAARQRLLPLVLQRVFADGDEIGGEKFGKHLVGSRVRKQMGKNSHKSSKKQLLRSVCTDGFKALDAVAHSCAGQ